MLFKTRGWTAAHDGRQEVVRYDASPSFKDGRGCFDVIRRVQLDWFMKKWLRRRLSLFASSLDKDSAGKQCGNADSMR